MPHSIVNQSCRRLRQTPTTMQLSLWANISWKTIFAFWLSFTYLVACLVYLACLALVIIAFDMSEISVSVEVFSDGWAPSNNKITRRPRKKECQRVKVNLMHKLVSPASFDIQWKGLLCACEGKYSVKVTLLTRHAKKAGEQHILFILLVAKTEKRSSSAPPGPDNNCHCEWRIICDEICVWPGRSFLDSGNCRWK